MPNETLQVGQHSVELVRSTRRKRISLEITATGIKLRSPMRTSLRVLREFAHSKKAWLDKHHRSLPEALPSLQLNDGLALNVFEQNIVIRYDYSRGGKATVDRELAEIVIPLGRNSDPKTAAKAKLLVALKDHAATEMEQRARVIAEQMDVAPKKVVAKDYKRRWGSCDRHSNLSFNWRLVFAPTTVTDYVIVHELAHIKVFNHSPAFWRKVAAHYPEHKLAKQWLNKHGAELYRLSLR